MLNVLKMKEPQNEDLEVDSKKLPKMYFCEFAMLGTFYESVSNSENVCLPTLSSQ